MIWIDFFFHLTLIYVWIFKELNTPNKMFQFNWIYVSIQFMFQYCYKHSSTVEHCSHAYIFNQFLSIQWDGFYRTFCLKRFSLGACFQIECFHCVICQPHSVYEYIFIQYSLNETNDWNGCNLKDLDENSMKEIIHIKYALCDMKISHKVEYICRKPISVVARG